MSAALTLLAGPSRAVVIRPAPRREPLFDDELPASGPTHGPRDRPLPFDRPDPRPALWQPRPPGPRDLPDPGPWGRRLLIGLIETAAGHRPLQQLNALLSPAVSRGLGGDLVRAHQAGAPHWLHRASVRSMRVAEPARGVAELCATVEVDRRVRAIAFRLEAGDDRWRCTRLQLG